jgi:hypothetical protein
MDDHLLKPADCAIRESRLIRDQAHDNLMQIRTVTARFQTSLRSALATEERNRLIGLETGKLVASLERLGGQSFCCKPAQGQFERRNPGPTPNGVTFRLLGSFWDDS